MWSAMAGARVVTDPAGNSKLAKGGQGRRMRCRDDAAAAILAVAEGRRRPKAETKRREFLYAIVWCGIVFKPMKAFTEAD